MHKGGGERSSRRKQEAVGGRNLGGGGARMNVTAGWWHQTSNLCCRPGEWAELQKEPPGVTELLMVEVKE